MKIKSDIYNLEKNGFRNSESKPNFYVHRNSIQYSDGESEKEILKILAQRPEENVDYNNYLESNIHNWVTEYHFSWIRTNILKPFKFNKKDRVLELGAGTGILTEYLANLVSNIIAIEGTETRANSIERRCQYQDNVTIMVANFLDLNLLEIFGSGSFDKITLIGVLEYVPKFSSGNENDSIQELLDVCNNLLKHDGELIIAIENKIGLKYLLGWEEDHLNIKHFGTESLYRKDGVQTFSKKELTKKLKINSFSNITFYYPFPDYKLPSLIIRDQKKSIYRKDSKRLISALFSNLKFRNYSESDTPEILVNRVLDNFLYEEEIGIISNSFLISAKKETSKPQNILKNFEDIYYYSVTRKFKYSSEIIFKIQEDNILMNKTFQSDSVLEQPLSLNKNSIKNQIIIDGELFQNILMDFYLKDNHKEFDEFFGNWIKFLDKNILFFPNRTFDLTPYNTILDFDNKFHFIDTEEWILKKDLTSIQIIDRYIRENLNMFKWFLDNENSLTDLISAKYNLPFISKVEKSHLCYLENFAINNIMKKNYSKEKIKNQDSKYKISEKKPLSTSLVKIIKNYLFKQ